MLIVGDDPWARAGLAAALGEESGLEVVGQLSSLAEWWVYQPDVVLWEVGEDSADLEALEPPVLVLVESESQAAAWLAHGARGVLLRDSEPEMLTAAIRALARGLVVIAPELTELTLKPQGNDLEAEPPLEPFTERELEVLRLLALGLSNKAIARRLEISERTTKFHVASILSKLGVHSRTEAVVRAARLGLVML
ncbi:response regulator transcription factor [Calidithermus roseus]|uniref:response regulator transcription factor n=1 Tax=Calidithermus roseus TaxID=1644118 RepID=UPI001C711BE0|nr:response regulator transcription factor [Calidithermus roseus]